MREIKLKRRPRLLVGSDAKEYNGNSNNYRDLN